jgi:hypothetical protein
VTEPQTVPTPAASLPVLPASGSGLLAIALLAVAAVGIGRFVLKLAGIAVLGGVVLATVAALTGGIAVLHAMLGH